MTKLKIRLKNTQELKLDNCPNCGADPNEEWDDALYPMNRERTLWTAGCYGCGSYIENATSEEDAILKWNQYAG